MHLRRCYTRPFWVGYDFYKVNLIKQPSLSDALQKGGRYRSGGLHIAEGETSEARFVPLPRENIRDYLTRPPFRQRVLDAMDDEHVVPFEALHSSPYDLLELMNVTTVYES